MDCRYQADPGKKHASTDGRIARRTRVASSGACAELCSSSGLEADVCVFFAYSATSEICQLFGSVPETTVGSAGFVGKQGVLLGAFLRDPSDATFTKWSFASVMKAAECSPGGQLKCKAPSSNSDWTGMKKIFDEYVAGF